MNSHYISITDFSNTSMNLKNVQKAASPNSIVSVVESTQNSYLSKSEDVLKMTGKNCRVKIKV